MKEHHKFGSPKQNIRMLPTMQASNVNDNNGGKVVMSSGATSSSLSS